jgi:hypothetical protein
MKSTGGNLAAIKAITAWLVAGLAEKRPEGRLQRVLVRHIVPGNRLGEEVASYEVPEDAGEGWANAEAVRIYDKLAAEASTLGGMQRWCLYAYCAEADGHVDRHLVRIQGTGDDAPGFDSEGPDKAGLVSQSMRHAEAFARINLSAQATNVQSLERLVGMLAERNEQLTKRNFEMVESFASLLDKKHEREIDLRMVDAKARALEGGLEKAGILVPAIVNRLMGKEVLPIQNAGTLALAKQLFASIASTPGQIEKLAQTLSPEQMVGFVTLAESVMGGSAQQPADADGSNGVDQSKGGMQ